MLKGTGLQIPEERYLYHWTCPVKLGVRVAERILRLPPGTPKVPAAWINETLYRLSRLEEKTLSSLPMPFGSSLLVIATAPAVAPDSASVSRQFTGKLGLASGARVDKTPCDNQAKRPRSSDG